MDLVKIAAAAVNQTALDWPGNKHNIIAAIASARQLGASIVCLPELCITGYGCEDAFLSADVQKRARAVLLEVVEHTEGLIVSLGLPLLHHGALFNCACLIADGELLGFVAKQNLAGDGIHYEPRWFKPWPHRLSDDVEIDGQSYPIGEVIFECGGVRIGFEICEDAWAASRPGSALALSAVDVILNPSASHFAFGKQDVRRRLVLESSRAFGVGYVYANLLGNEAGRVIYDGACLIASGGRMAAEGRRFSFANHLITTAVLDLDTTRMNRAKLASFQPAEEPRETRCVEHPFTFPKLAPEKAAAALGGWETGGKVKEEEFARAVSLGLFDYLRKSRANGFVVSLSGGADSAAVALLVSLLVKFGSHELGIAGLLKKLPHIGRLANAASDNEIIHELLLCVYQATRNSSDTTRTAATELAAALHAEFMLLDIDQLVQSYIGIIAHGIGRELTWAQDDIALQNIQARVRSPGVWLLANLRGALLLSTSNRSEAAVSYATMDGDTSGGLSPIAGIDKAFLLRWLDWMHRTGPEGEGSVPALSRIIVQAPTAELRPPAAAQTDEADLMPYELLDAIERAAIRDKHGPVEIFGLMRAEFPAYSAAQLAIWVERFFRLWSRNQWKRERYAPSFHLDDENLDPKTWCRFPILSGGFEQELAELRALVQAEAK
ncbi:MAG: NAD(+) synthase [Planctomycetia bacterium]|nr:NAD(+) synthase [Planctomycetia bacterium]